jgi:hypothetical protein
MNFIKFLKAAGYIGLGSVGLAIVLLAISIDEHLRDKSVPSYWLMFIAAVAFAFGAYRAWAAEHEAYQNEVAENAKPSLQIEMMGVFFDVSPNPDLQQLQVRLHIYTYLRVTNLTTPETIIKDGHLVMTVGSNQYKAMGDDKGMQGNALEHISDFKIGGETTKTDVFGKTTLSPFKRLASVVNSNNPLKRGITQEGFVVFTFTDQSIDWDHENAYLMPVSDFVLTLRDSFNGLHEYQAMILKIPEAHLKTTTHTSA